MKTPVWEQSAGALVALINTGQFVYAHIYTVTLAGGAGVLRFTDADLNITDTTNTWDSRGIRVDLETSRTLAHWKRGLDVDTWLLALLPRVVDEITGAAFPDKINGVPYVQAVAGGAFDGADIVVDRAYFSAWPQPYQLTNTPVGILRIFVGLPAEIDLTDTQIIVTINDYRDLLNTKMPRNVFQAGCGHTLYDSGCTLVAATFAKNGTAIGGTTRKSIKSVPIVPGGSGTFVLGKLTMTSGLNATFSRTVKQWSSAGGFDLLNPFPFDVVAGDTFQAFPGCDKTQATCNAFANILNYGGEPFIPAAETAM